MRELIERWCARVVVYRLRRDIQGTATTGQLQALALVWDIAGDEDLAEFYASIAAVQDPAVRRW